MADGERLEPVEGEVLPPLTDVVLQSSPFVAPRVLHVGFGSTVEDIVRSTGATPAMSAHVQVFIDDQQIEPAMWHLVKPKLGAVVNVRYQLHGGGGGKDTLRAIAMIAVMVVAMAVAGPLAGMALGFLAPIGVGATTLAIATGVAQVVVATAGMMLVQALIPPPGAKNQWGFDQELGNPYGQITGLRNQMAPYGPIPRVLGRRRMYPMLAGRPYTETQGNDQYLRLLLLVGLGPLAISDIKLGETPISAYPGIEIETREGWVGDADVTLYQKAIKEDSYAVVLDAAGSTTTKTTRLNTKEISVEIGFPSGVNRVDKGELRFHEVSFTVQYRVAGSSGAWINADWLEPSSEYGTQTDGVLFVRDKTQAGLRRSGRWTVSPGQYEVKITRTSPIEPMGEVGFAIFTTLRSIVDEEFLPTDGMALIALRMKASGQLNGVPDQINCVAQSYLPVYSPGPATWAYQLTRNPAWAFADLLRRRGTATINADSRIDLTAIVDWANACASTPANGPAPYWTFDGVLEGGSIFTALRTVASHGRANFTIRDGKYSVVRDVVQTVPVQHISPRNSWGYAGSKVFAEIPHALRVRFSNEDKLYADDEVVVYAPGYSADGAGATDPAVTFETLDMPGISRASQAWREGMYHFAVLQLRMETHTVSMDVENLRCTLGSLVQFSHDAISVGLAHGRVTAVTISGPNITHVVLDSEVQCDPGELLGLRCRKANFATAALPVVNPASASPVLTDTLQLVTPIAIASGPEVGDLFQYGIRGLETAPMIVKRIAPGPDLTAVLSLTNAQSGIWTADQGTIPAFNSYITTPRPFERAQPPVPVMRLTSDSNTARYTADSTIIERIAVAFDAWPSAEIPVESVEVQYRDLESPNFTPLPRQPRDTAGFFIDPVYAGAEYEVRARSISPYGLTSEWVTAQIEAAGKTAPPDAPTSLTATNGGGAQVGKIVLNWGLPTDIDLWATEVWAATTNNRALATLVDSIADPGKTYEHALAGTVSRYYWVRTRDLSGNYSTAYFPAGATSGVLGQTRAVIATDLDTTPPATPGTVTLSQSTTLNTDGTSVTLMTANWPDNSESDLDGYQVEWLEGGTSLGRYPVSMSQDTIRVRSGVSYEVRVWAVDKLGNVSALNSFTSLTATGKTSLPPAITSGSATAIGGRRVRVVQKRPTMTDYLHTLIFRNTTGMSPDDVPQTVYTVATDEEFVDVNVTVGTNYRYYGRTVDRTGNEAATATFLGNAIPVFTSVAGGDVSSTDPVLVTQYGTALNVQNQQDWATYTGRTITHLANAIDTSSYLISGLNTHFRPDQMMNGAVGTQLAFDPEFHQAWPPADSGIYNNGGGTKVTITRVADVTAPNASGFKLTIAYDGTGTPDSNPSPGFGGIYQGLLYAGDGNPSRPNRYAKNTKILYKIWANIPVGRTLETAANSYGTEGTATWLTSQAGTGNWALYELVYYIGTTGAFSSIGHMYVAGGTNVAFSWHIAKYEQVDITSGVSAFTGNLRRVNNGAALSDTLLVTGDGTAAFVAGQSPWVTDTSLTPTTVTNRTQRLTSAGQIDFAYIEGATRPSPNAGTSGVLTAIGSFTTVVGNTVSKSGGTHGAYQGGAVGAPQRGSAYIQSSLQSVVTGGGWLTHVALDDDATSFAFAASYLAAFSSGVGTGTVYLYKDGVQIGSQSGVTVTTASRMLIGYDGAAVFVQVDGVRYFSTPAPAGLRLWPKIIDYYNNGPSNYPAVDVLYGAWTENTVSTVTLVPYNADTSVTGSTATKVGGSNGGWGAGVYSRDRFTGSAYCTFRVGTHTQPYFMAGLASSAFDGLYNTINYSWFAEGLPATSTIRAYVGGYGTHWEGAAGTWAITDVFTIVYDGVRVQWFQNGILRATYTPVAAGQVLGFAASQVYIGNNLTDIQVGPALQVPRIGQNTFDDSGGALVGRTNLITSLGTANLVANQTRFATATSLSTADADIAAPWSALDSRPAVTQGDSLTEDTAMADPAAWTLSNAEFQAIDLPPAGTAIKNITGLTGFFASARTVPVDRTKTYMVEGYVYSWSSTSAVSSCYGGVALETVNGTNISGDGTFWLYNPAGVTLAHNEIRYFSSVFGAGTGRPIPTNAMRMKLIGYPNYGNVADANHWFSGWRIVEVTTVGGSLRRADGTVATEAALVTSLGTANLVANQGPGATALANRVLNDRFEGGVKLIQQPDGGQYNNPVSGQVGQLEIVLPFAWNAASPMITFDVLVHDYTAGRTSTYTVAGHHYNTGSNGTWINVTATFNGPRVFSRPVKFGFNAAGKATVWIGSVGDLWQYPNITIRNVQIGYNSQALAWESGWSVALNNTAISGTYVNMTTPYWARIVDVPRSGDQVFGEGIYEAPPGSGLPGDNVIATRASHRTDQGTALNIVNQALTATSSDFAVVTGATRPSDRATSDLSMIAADAHVTIQGNRIGKASGGYTWTTGSAYSRQWYVGGASASARRLQSGGLAETMFGLSDSYTLGDAGYVHIDYAFYLFSSSSLPHIQLYEGGAPQGAAILVAMGDLFTVTYDGVNVRYYRESAGVSTLLRTVATTAARAFRVHVATTGADNVSSGVEDLRLTPFNRAARVDELWSADGATQYAENLIRTAAGTALNVINQGELATSTLTEAKVQGRWFGQYAGDSAANTAGLQNGDSYVDTSVYPPVLKGKTGGTIYEISETGILLDTDTDVDLVGTGTTFTNIHSYTLPAAVSTSSFFVIQLGLSIVSGTTVSGSGATAPSGLWELWEFDSASTDATKRLLHSGSWASQIIGAGPNAANLTDITVDGDSYSDISRQWKFKFGGGGILRLRMHQGGGPNLLNARSHIRVTVQRN